MRTYTFDDITIEIGAEVVAVHHVGKTITPKEKRKIGLFTAFKRLSEEFYKNNYFRRRTKAHVAMRGAEGFARCFGAGSIYMMAREQVWPIIHPWLPIAVDMIKQMEWPDIIMHFDMGFVIGVLTTMIGLYCKKKTYKMILHERGSKA